MKLLPFQTLKLIRWSNSPGLAWWKWHFWSKFAYAAAKIRLWLGNLVVFCSSTFRSSFWIGGGWCEGMTGVFVHPRLWLQLLSGTSHCLSAVFFHDVCHLVRCLMGWMEAVLRWKCFGHRRTFVVWAYVPSSRIWVHGCISSPHDSYCLDIFL